MCTMCPKHGVCIAMVAFFSIRMCYSTVVSGVFDSSCAYPKTSNLLTDGHASRFKYDCAASCLKKENCTGFHFDELVKPNGINCYLAKHYPNSSLSSTNYNEKKVYFKVIKKIRRLTAADWNSENLYTNHIPGIVNRNAIFNGIYETNQGDCFSAMGYGGNAVQMRLEGYFNVVRVVVYNYAAIEMQATAIVAIATETIANGGLDDGIKCHTDWVAGDPMENLKRLEYKCNCPAAYGDYLIFYRDYNNLLYICEMEVYVEDN